MSDYNKPAQTKEPEIRYVPVQFLEGYAPQSGNDEVEIDLMDILKRIWDGRKSILVITAVFAIMGVLYSISTPNEYTTTVKLLPEAQQSNNLGRFGSLAAQFGIGGGSGEAVLSAQFYPQILSSTDFLYDMVSKQIYFEEVNDSVTIQSYYNEHQKSNAFKDYTIGLPYKVLGFLESKILGLFRSAPDTTEAPVLSNEAYRRIPPRVMGAFGGLSQSVSITGEQTSILTLTVTTQAPEVTVQIANHVTEALSTYLIENRTEKSRRNLEIIQVYHAEARSNFELEQDRLARFRDQNQGNLTAAARTIEQNIQSEYNVKLNVYNSLTEQLEQAKIKLQEDTPVISIFQDSIYPNSKSAPNHRIQILMSIFLGALIGVMIVILKPLVLSFTKKFN